MLAQALQHRKAVPMFGMVMIAMGTYVILAPLSAGCRTARRC